MTSEAAYGIALRIADLYGNILKFFITICSLFGGWIVVQGLPPVTGQRAVMALIFLCSTGALLSGQMLLLKRADAALALARRLLEQESGPIDPEIAPLFATKQSWITRYSTPVGMGGVMIGILALIPWAKDYVP